MRGSTSVCSYQSPPISETRPLDLQYDPNAAKPANGDAAAQYKAGYDAIVHGDYAFAENQFKEFLAAYPDDPQAARLVVARVRGLQQHGPVALHDQRVVRQVGHAAPSSNGARAVSD